MNAEEFINELMVQTGLSEEQATAANEIFENTLLVGNRNKGLIINQLTERLNIGETQANIIYNTAIGLLADGAVDKIKGLFKK